MGEVEGVPGVSWHPQGDWETGKQGGGGLHVTSRRRARAPVLLSKEEDDRGQRWWAGRPATVLGLLVGAR